MTTNYQRILNFIELIQRKPKKDVKFFFFDKGKIFIVDGKMVKLLPLEYQKLASKDEFYLHINPEEKKIMYWAYNIKDFIEAKPIETEEGYIEWDKAENPIYNFFVTNIKKLSESSMPYSEVSGTKTSSPVSGYVNKDHNAGDSFMSGSTNKGSSYSGSSNYNSSYSDWNSASYKEREAFFDKLKSLIKENRTTFAIDLIDDQIGKMKAENRFDDINTIFNRIWMESLSTSTMIELLRVTAGDDGKIKERKGFYEKVKIHLGKMNIKPERQNKVLKNLMPAV